MSSTEKKIFQNVLVLGITDVGTKGLTLLLMVVMARKLGPALVGVHAFGATVAAIIQIFIDFGLTPYIQREVGRSPESAKTMLSEVLGLKLITGSAAALLLLALMPFLAPESPKREIVLILTGAMFFHSCIAAISAFFRAMQMSQLEALVRLGFRIGYTVMALTALLCGGGLIAVVGLELIAAFGAFLLALHLMRKKVGIVRVKISWSQALLLAKTTWNFLLINIVQTIFNSIDLLMLSFMCGDVYTGYYSMACRLISAFDFLPSSLSGGFMPVLSREAFRDEHEFSHVFGGYFRWNLLIGASVGVMLAAFAEDLVPLLFGAGFAPAAPTLCLMAIAYALTLVNWPLSTTIIALNLESKILRLFTLGAVVNILLNLWFIPALRDQGAAWTTILSALLFVLLQGRVLGAELRRRTRLAQVALGPLASAVLTFLLIRFLRPFELGMIFNLAVGVCGFLCLALATKALRTSDFVSAVRYLALRGKSAS